MLRMKRRSFLKLAAATGAAATIAPRLASAKIEYPDYPQGRSGVAPDSDSGHEWKTGLCLACHGGCPIIGKVKDGELLKVEGNPYGHNTHDYVIPKGTYAQAGQIDFNDERGTVCPKGAAGVYTLYNPRRLLHPVKRVGARGSRSWKRISWDQAYDEIANGGNLFGEGHVDGLSAIKSDAPIDGGDSDYMDEAPPDGYGPKRNQFRWERGRNENGPVTNLLHQGFGTLNKGTHWSICEASERILTGMIGNSGAVHDAKNADYLISAGGNIYDASFPAQTQARHLSKWFLRRPGTKYVYVGPRQAKSAGPAGNTEWVPIKVGTDPAFALGMLRYIIENNAYASDMISRPNADAAAAGGYPASTDATWLVKTSEPRGYLTDADGDNLVVSGGIVVKSTSVTTADLNGATAGATSAFSLLSSRAMSMTMDEYDDACGIPRGTIARIAGEFTSASKPVIYQYKGPCQKGNATGSSAYAIINVVMDRMWRVGGSSGRGGGAHGHVGTAEDKPSKTGVEASRSTRTYAGAKGTPTFPWYPLNPSAGGDGVQTATFEGLANNYPYKVKALWLYRSDPPFTLPRAQTADVGQANADLVVSVDPFMNEASALADFVLPDTTFMEHYGEYHSHGLVKHNDASMRTPLVGTEDHANKKFTSINPDVRTVSDIHIEMAMKLGLPNVGPGGAGHGEGFVNGYQFYDLYFNNAAHDEHGLDEGHNWAGGLTGEHRKIGGQYGSSLDRHDLKTGKHLSIYLEPVATTKNSLSGEYMDGLPYVGQIVGDGSLMEDHWDMSQFLVGTNKVWQHTQARTGENLWLMSLEPTNALDMNPEDAAKYGVRSGDWVELTSPDGDTGRHQIAVTNTTRPGYGEIPNGWGHWELGAADHAIEGHEGGGIKGDARVGSGTNYVRIMAADPSYEGKGAATRSVPNDPIGGSCHQYGFPVSVKKV